MILNRAGDAPTKGGTRNLTWAWAAVILAIAFNAGVRLRLLDMPLERDEGEYAYIGQLMLQGVPPYQSAYTMKFPGTAAAYALIMAVFGETPAGIHAGLIVVNTAGIVLLFLITRRLLDDYAGAVAATVCALMSPSPSVLGLAAHATHFVVVAALGGLECQLRAMASGQRRWWFAAGAGYGLAMLMKQPGLIFGVFGLCYALWVEARRKPAAWRAGANKAAGLCAGLATPLALTCAALAVCGVFGKFVFWTITYAREYGLLNSPTAIRAMLHGTLLDVKEANGGFWALALVGLLLAGWAPRLRGWRALLFGFAGGSALAVCPGFYFRAHYFILLLPAAAMLAGVAVSASTAWLKSRTPAGVRALPMTVFCCAMAHSVASQWDYFFVLDPVSACRERYGMESFPESLEIARFLRAHSLPDDRIGVLGSEPQICFYAHRRSASRYIYTYALVEKQRFAGQMRDELEREIEAARPKFMVMVNISTSWLFGPGADAGVFVWARDYTLAHYDIAGFFDIISPDRTLVFWNEEARRYQPKSDHFVVIFRRKDVN
jgi:hypothetical protein